MTWQIELRHDGLNAYRVIRGRDQREVEQKALMQQRVWDERWKAVQKQAQRKETRDFALTSREQQRMRAESLTREAQRAIDDLQATLETGLARDPCLDFDSLEEHEPFPAPPPAAPQLYRVAAEPEPALYAAKLSLVDYVLPPLRRKKEQAAAAALALAEHQWRQHRDGVAAENARLTREHEQHMRDWKDAKATFLQRQREHNESIAQYRAQYHAADPEAIVDYCSDVLSRSPYPDYFPRNAAISYVPEAKRLLVDYDLPSPESLPRLKEAKFSSSKGIVEHEHTSAFLQKLYDALLYQISLRSIHELFTADAINALESIAFNGWVHSVDKRTGHDTYAVILSLHVTRQEFRALDLARVDPKACFRQLKGVAGSRLAELAAVQPIVQLNRNDQRFVAGQDITVEQGENLAAMDWEDFEHLIRQVFEQEFSANGGEVHITRASRDAGVDAVAFDPDPIRGGRIVIQAKRYTNTVDVSAVRDLYGTVHNEGATKGILVTTADFGSDSYEFVKGKPLTLINGSNLLYLLEKHGRKARIDLREAREALQGQSRIRGNRL